MQLLNYVDLQLGSSMKYNLFFQIITKMLSIIDYDSLTRKKSSVIFKVKSKT